MDDIHNGKCCPKYLKVRDTKQHHFQREWFGYITLFTKDKNKIFSYILEKNLFFFLQQFVSFIPVFHP